MESRTEHKLNGIRTIVGTMDKANPKTVYWDSTISINGTQDLTAMSEATSDIDDYLTEWIRYNQDDYDKKRYIKLVTYPDSEQRTTSHYVAKTRRLHYELTLLHKDNQTWETAVEISNKHLDKIYDGIARIVSKHGLVLQNFRGYNNKTK